MNLRVLLERKPGLLLTQKSLRSLFNDVYQNDMTKVNLMMTAYNIHIVDALRSHYPLDQFEKARLVKLMVQQHAIVEDKANWAIDEWLNAITPAVLRGLDAAGIEEKEAAAKKAQQLAAEQAAREEAERIAREQQEQRDLDALRMRDEYENFYTNPTLEERPDRIYVPCGIGNTDNGFFIHGISRGLLCKHPNATVYALVYNYLVRSSRIADQDIPRYIREMDTPYELDYRSIFRLTMVLLQLIRHNHIKGNDVVLSMPNADERQHIRYAAGLINHYAALFCRLIGIPEVTLRVSHGANGFRVSLSTRTGIYVENNQHLISNAREMWYGAKINYRLKKSNLEDLEYILSEISPFDSFKEGQFSVLCSMLGKNDHSVCIMPTGSGKSLIYYMASLLQPLPFFVVAPTEILIEDQIRNLRKTHRMDNVAHLLMTDDNSFRDYEIHNSLNYVTPMTLQNRNIHVKFRHINNGTKWIDGKEESIAPGALAANIVLDEIHCLSNWGHDFRPEYLMLSRFLTRFLDRVKFWGFTATANYTVVEDVQRQLNIPQQNFFSPISFEKYNVSYDFRALDTQEEMYAAVGKLSQQLIDRNERTIIFTKNEDISRRVAEVVGYEADVFAADNPETYYQFADGKCRVLIASDELGVGINLPNVRNIIHFGLPLSKNEYVQEIGRAGRANERVMSYVLYLNATPANVPAALLQRSTPMDKIPNLLTGLNSDYGEIYRRLTNNCPVSDVLYEALLKRYQEFVVQHEPIYMRTYSYEDLALSKQYLYMLHVVGYIADWYCYRMSTEKNGVDIFIKICDSEQELRNLKPGAMARRMQNKLRDYFSFLGNNREEIAKTNLAKTEEDLIRVYVEWYYAKYLYHHNEEFLDLYDFIVSNSEADHDKITETIKDYFVLPFIQIKQDEELYNEMSLRDIATKVCVGINRASLVNIERINSNRYSYRMDYLLFCGRLRYNSSFESSRLERIWSRISENERSVVVDSLPKLYAVCDSKGRLEILKYVSNNNLFKLDLNNFLRLVYASGEKDLIYYGFVSEAVNKYFGSVRRIQNV